MQKWVEYKWYPSESFDKDNGFKLAHFHSWTVSVSILQQYEALRRSETTERSRPLVFLSLCARASVLKDMSVHSVHIPINEQSENFFRAC